MEPHELDKYIGNKLREAENAAGEGEISGMNRVWSAIEPQLEKRTSFAMDENGCRYSFASDAFCLFVSQKP